MNHHDSHEFLQEIPSFIFVLLLQILPEFSRVITNAESLRFHVNFFQKQLQFLFHLIHKLVKDSS